MKNIRHKKRNNFVPIQIRLRNPHVLQAAKNSLLYQKKLLKQQFNLLNKLFPKIKSPYQKFKLRQQPWKQIINQQKQLTAAQLIQQKQLKSDQIIQEIRNSKWNTNLPQLLLKYQQNLIQ